MSGRPFCLRKAPKEEPRELTLEHQRGSGRTDGPPRTAFQTPAGASRGHLWARVPGSTTPSLPRSLHPRVLGYAHRHSGHIGASFAPRPSALGGSQELEEDRPHMHTEAGGRRGQGQTPLDERGRLIQPGKERGSGPGRRGQQAPGPPGPTPGSKRKAVTESRPRGAPSGGGEHRANIKRRAETHGTPSQGGRAASRS